MCFSAGPFWGERRKQRYCNSKNKLLLHLKVAENLKPLCNSCWDFMSTNTQISHTDITHLHTPSHCVHVWVKYVRCVLEVRDNVPETHAVLLSCTLRSIDLCLIYSFATLPSHLFICTAAKLSSYFSFFFCHPLTFVSLCQSGTARPAW